MPPPVEGYRFTKFLFDITGAVFLVTGLVFVVYVAALVVAGVCVTANKILTAVEPAILAMLCAANKLVRDRVSSDPRWMFVFWNAVVMVGALAFLLCVYVIHIAAERALERAARRQATPK